MYKTMTWSDILAYIRWSAYQRVHAEDAMNPEGPVTVRFWNGLRGWQWMVVVVVSFLLVLVTWVLRLKLRGA